MLATRSASWPLAPLDRLGLRCLAPPDAERMLRRCTSVALKKATMKGCLFWGPLRPISPATRGLMLSPAGGGRERREVRGSIEHRTTALLLQSHLYKVKDLGWKTVGLLLNLVCVYVYRDICGLRSPSLNAGSQVMLRSNVIHL